MRKKTKRTIRRRRREGKTDYKARLNLLKSGLPRVIIRKTNNYIILFGKKIVEKEKNTNSILDLGLQKSQKKGRIFAALKGIVDAGVNIKHKKEIFPDEKRIKGDFLKNKINIDEIIKKI